MMTPEECRKQAAICHEMAERARSKGAKDGFNWTARAWIRLAESYSNGAKLREEVIEARNEVRPRLPTDTNQDEEGVA